MLDKHKGYWLRIKTDAHEKISPYGEDTMAAHVQFNNLIGSLIANGYQANGEGQVERVDLVHPEREGVVVLELLDQAKGRKALFDQMFRDTNLIFIKPIAEPFPRLFVRT